jgi:arylsulfate sulfotransferase
MRLWNSLRKALRRTTSYRCGRRRLEVEALEERALLALTFVPLDVPGSTLTDANGINNSGAVVGTYTAGGVTHGFLLRDGSYTTLDVPGAARTEAWAINDSGDVVGSYTAGGVTHGFLLSGAAYTTFDPPGSTFTVPRGISNSGRVVGGYTAAGTSHDFVLSGGEFTTIDVPGALFTSYASGISDRGQVVGRFDTGSTNFGFLLSGGAYTTLDVPGSVSSAALGVNNSGRIVGGYTAAGARHGYLLSGGTYTQFDVPGSTFTTPRKVNDSGTIVGGYGAGGTTHGFLATPVPTVSLAPSEAAPQLVGEPVTWTATASDCGATPVYQFSVAPHGGDFRVVRDFSPTNTFAWTPMQEGTYDVKVAVKDGYQAAETHLAVVSDAVASRVAGSQAVVTPTLNPLVALYSVPPSPAATVFVQFAVAGDHPAWRNTDARAVVPGKSTNVFVAGLLPNTTYQMRHVFSDGTGSAPLLFTTGSIPSTLNFPPITAPQPPGPGSDLNQDVLFQSHARPPQNAPYVYATDLTGQIIWYYDASQAGFLPNNPAQGASLVPGGTVLVMGANSNAPLPLSRNILREIDLAGNSLRETNLDAVNAQLRAQGHDIIYSFTNDAQRLPNGQTAVIAFTEHTVNINGTPTNYIGNTVVVLDGNFQVTWAWDGFDHLDVNRGPVLGEIVVPGDTVPSAAVPLLPAVDWLHTNSVNWSPEDQNLLLSVRHQDWVIKIDYRNGAGDGHVIWRLGQGGDFTVHSTDPSPWFSHQHNSHYLDASTLILFDNGNTRHAGDPAANSRGQVWTLDEQSRTATLGLNADMGNYSDRVGSAQRLSNGNYVFTSGAIGRAPFVGQSIEVFPDGAKASVLQVGRGLYRSYRTRTLYEGIDDALAGAPRTVESIVLNDGSAQRSMVNRITVTFDGAAVLDPGAIELRRQDGRLVGARLSIALIGGKTVAVLTFAGPEFVGGSLADGSYTLTVRADRIHDRWGRELDGDGNGTAGGDRVDGFFRLFGDGDGDGDVDGADRDLFRSAFKTSAGDAGYVWYFDFDGDGDVDGHDNGQFHRRFGQL